MDVKNSQGRTVSLLNDELPRLSNLPALTSPSTFATTKKSPSAITTTRPSLYHYSRYSPPTLPHQPSSYSSSASARSSNSSLPTLSPGSNPPPLSRSDSSDSRAGSSPSPLTPLSTGFDNLRELRKTLPRKYSSTFDGLPSLSTLREQQKIPQTRSPMDFTNQPPLGNDFAFTTSTGAPFLDPLTTAPLQQIPVTAAGFDATAAPPIPNITPTQQVFPTPITTPKSSAKKNQYPCPLSKQYNCSEFFTTSGHAARHAKKHTGKKDAICPECGKGFTRKDNMEQHRRTHSGGRNKSNSTNSESSTNSKSAPNKDSEEAKARHKMRQQQRKSRPTSISTGVPPPPMTISIPQQQIPITTQAILPPQGDMLDPALRESALNGFFSPGAEFSLGFGFPMQTAGPQGPFPAPQAPMQAQSRKRAISSPREMPAGAGKPVSPSAVPREAGLDKLDILAEASSRRSSE